MKSTFSHPVVGEVTICKSNRSRRIALSVRPDGCVRLSIPLHFPVRDALRFLDEKLPWVTATQARVRARFRPQVITEPYATRCHTLQLDVRVEERITVSLRPPRDGVPGIIRVCYPAQADPAGEEVQEAIRRGVERAWREEAKALLPRRVEQLARESGLRYRSVTVRNTRSRWGSCSGRDDISLSLHLMRLPEHLIDYIIIHELCHTVHRNHGPGFYELLDRLTGGRAQTSRAEMKKYSPRR